MDSAQRESTQKRERMAFFLVGLNLGQGMGFVFLDKRVSTELWLTKQFRGMETKRVVLLRRVCTKTIFSPRQARDKHRESTQKKRRVFLQGFLNPFIYQVRKRVFLRHFYTKCII